MFTTAVYRTLLSFAATAHFQPLSMYISTSPTFFDSVVGAPKPCPILLKAPNSAGRLDHVGVNIAGFDFGCRIDGASEIEKYIEATTFVLTDIFQTCTAAGAWPPLSQYKGESIDNPFPNNPTHLKIN
jgi:hypothetical protein